MNQKDNSEIDYSDYRIPPKINSDTDLRISTPL